MGKEASKHQAINKPVNPTAQKGPTAGKPRAKSFTVGDKTRLTPGPSQTPPSPAGTPKSRSPASSPKLVRRNGAAKDASKGRNVTRKTAEQKKQDIHNRPHSDPLIAEKIHGKKKLSGVAANEYHTKGKAKPDLEAVKKEVKDLEAEKLELKEKIQGMEHRLDVVPLLEKEKLHLQKQLNELVQENEKKSSELQTLNLVSEKQREDKVELQLKHDKLMIGLQNIQQELEEVKDRNHSLEESNSTLVRENEEKMQSISKCLEDIENLTNSNTELVLQDGRSRNKISTLLQGLQSLKDSVVQLKDENKCLQTQIIENGSEFVGRMKNCVSGLENVIDCLEKEKTGKVDKETQVSSNVETRDVDTQCDELLPIHLSSDEVEKSKHAFKSSVDELENPIETSELPETPNIANEQKKPATCSRCINLEEQLVCLKSSLDSFKASLQKTESDRDDAVEERNELRREAKYLKYVLSYREDVQSLQMSKQQSKELEKMESNLVDAEKKVIDLEEEVGRLQEEKQTLLLSILNLHSGNEVDDVKEEDEEEEENMVSAESETNDENQDKGNMSEGSRTPDSISRREQLKFRFQLSLSESEYSYSSEQRSEDEDESESEQEDLEEITAQPGLHVKTIKTENKQLKSRLSEANEEKEELLSSLDKLCEEFDSLKANFDKLEEQHAVLSNRSRHDKEALQARLQEVEIDRDNMRDSLRQVQDEKLELLKCLEMRNPEPIAPLSPMTQLDLDKIIARAQSFTQAENKSNEPTSNEEDSEASSSSDAEDEQRNKLEPNDKAEVPTTLNDRFRPGGQPVVTQSAAEDTDLASLVASIENDLGKLKERLNKRGDVQDENTGKGVQSRPWKPPPGERILKRQASTVKSNLDRVCREKQHLQHEVESLRRYLLKRRDSAMETRKKRSPGSFKKVAAEVESHLEGIKTLQALLGKSDEQLRQSNEIISRLEAVNDETEDKLRDAELLKDDMRYAVQIANNFAMEEQQRADKLMSQNQELLKTIEILKSTHPSADQEDKDEHSNKKPTANGKSKLYLKEAKGFNRSVSEDDGLYADDESTFTTEGESDFFSSRHSSFASESDFVTSPTSYEENLDSLNSTVPVECTPKNRDTETEGRSQHSSAADTSDLTDDETE